MTRLRATALLVAVFAMSAACADNILKERPTTRVAATTQTAKPTFSAAGSARGGSTVCSAYRRQLRVVQLRQLTQSGKAQADALKAKELSLNAVIADACE
jgi:hypothetical protein